LFKYTSASSKLFLKNLLLKTLNSFKTTFDDSIICKTRDGSISRINIEGTLVNFLLPFRDKDTKKIYNDSKEE
jgi:hypothetical protein